MKKRLLALLLFMLLILFMTYRFEFNGGNKDKNRLFTSSFTSLITDEESDEINRNRSLISANELKEIIKKERVELIAISNQELKNYIPDSSRVTIDNITTTKNGIDGLIADRDQIEQLLSKKGLDPKDTIIVYDENQSLFAARLWWTLKAYGHKDVRILDGGLKEWKRQGYETVVVPKIEKKSIYKAKPLNENLITTIKDIEKSIKDQNKVVVDVRTKDEYDSGHIPSAVNIPWNMALNTDGTFKSSIDLGELYKSKGVTDNLDAIYTQCSKGIRASHTYFVLTQLLDYQNVKLYDGSWLEYSQSKLPIEK